MLSTHTPSRHAIRHRRRAYLGCLEKDGKLSGWPGLTKVGKVCIRHQSALANTKIAQKKLELTNILAEVASGSPRNSLKEDFATAVTEAGITLLSASGPKIVKAAPK